MPCANFKHLVGLPLPLDWPQVAFLSELLTSQVISLLIKSTTQLTTVHRRPFPIPPLVCGIAQLRQRYNTLDEENGSPFQDLEMEHCRTCHKPVIALRDGFLKLYLKNTQKKPKIACKIIHEFPTLKKKQSCVRSRVKASLASQARHGAESHAHVTRGRGFSPFCVSRVWFCCSISMA